MKRIVQPEDLDSLPPGDTRAIKSRQDLRRLNRVMGHPRFIARALAAITERNPKPQLADIGCGDGSFFLEIARRIRGATGRVVLVDRLNVVDSSVVQKIKALGWDAESAQADIHNWLEHAPQLDVIIANLFLHHFQDQELRCLFKKAAAASNALIACEPRRSRMPYIAAHLVGIGGAGSVTRNDAILSVRAGFNDRDLSALWPEAGWQMCERPVGLFSHLFITRRNHA